MTKVVYLLVLLKIKIYIDNNGNNVKTPDRAAPNSYFLINKHENCLFFQVCCVFQVIKFCTLIYQKKNENNQRATATKILVKSIPCSESYLYGRKLQESVSLSFVTFVLNSYVVPFAFYDVLFAFWLLFIYLQALYHFKWAPILLPCINPYCYPQLFFLNARPQRIVCLLMRDFILFLWHFVFNVISFVGFFCSCYWIWFLACLQFSSIFCLSYYPFWSRQITVWLNLIYCTISSKILTLNIVLVSTFCI